MKVLALLLVCAVAVQGRSTAVEPVHVGRTLAARGDAPYLVHLRIAKSTSGFLDTAAGSLVSSRWVLTTADAVQNLRFAWVRYGAATVINPSLVTESGETSFTVQPSGYLAVINVNRDVESTDYISPIGLAGNAAIPSTVLLYLYGENGDGGAGEQLSSFEARFEEETESNLITAESDDGRATRFDIGAPLVSEGQQIGVLVAAEAAGTFVRLSDDDLTWIAGLTG